ncbi:energy transducer TonB [Pseudomonas azotoformans]|uniref:Protein TonB n=1 Tax=Pseudomonas azotoformans TaxID=47878 RepID=A0A1V2J2W7_PSEAZ|nr:energy transducer TonB [Pseudomonas azotoformans]OIN46648.1 energy transducer TonB [Pseudomonas azotoformans]ONH39774.1 energy transducer TonB [Pseudomonas azotoformans]SDM95673.1 outer membrane transport energization protein TonB [Pseudomonas azotoformans]
MTAMIMHSPLLAVGPGEPSGFWRNSVAASLAVALHVGVLAALMLGWSTEKPPVEAPRVMHTQLVMLPAAPVPAPAPEPVAITPLEPVAVPVPVKPTVDPQIQARKLEQAALARKRVEEKQQEQQRLATEQRNREQAQQRADQQRQAAETARAATPAAAPAFDSRQYQPLSKDAPDYPERALDKHIEGDCSVEYTVNTQGRVENPRVLDGCHPLFMRPSLAAANTFRYQPRIVDGKPVPVPAVRNTFHYRIK